MSWFNQFTSKDPARQGVAEQTSLGLWKKRGAWLIALFAMMFLATHLTVRFYVWPKVEANKSSFEQVISQNLGVNLQIQSIRTGWDFLWPSFEIEKVDLYEQFDYSKYSREDYQIMKIKVSHSQRKLS